MTSTETVPTTRPGRPEDRALGQPLARVDGPAKVTGTAKFTADIPVPDLAHAALACSTVAAGSIRSIDVGPALRAPGVLRVMTHLNAPRMRRAPLLFGLQGASYTNAPIMQDATIRWNGEPVAVVVAETLEQAEHAASLIAPEYDVAHDPRVAFTALLGTSEVPETVQGQPPEVIVGDADAALETAHVTIDHTYRTPFHSNAAIEPHATTVQWHDEHRLTMWDATQAVTLSRTTLATVFNLRPEDVRVVSHFVGGAFGSKDIWSYQVLCAGAARLTGRPVRLALSRSDVFRVTGGRTVHQQRVALGAGPDGSLSALIHEGTTAIGVDGNGFAEQFTFPARTLYQAENLRASQRVVELHMVPNAAMRAPGDSVGSFALESAVDELAAKLRMDPLQLRGRIEARVNPISGQAFSSRNLLRAYQDGATQFGWADRSPSPRAQRDGEWWVGQGLAAATYPYVRMPGSEVELELTSDERVVVRTAAHEMGMGTATVQAQLAAELLGLDPDQVRVEYGDSRLPSGSPAGGSSQTASIAAALQAAYGDLVTRLLTLVPPDSSLAGADTTGIQARDGGLHLIGRSDGHRFGEILDFAGLERLQARGAGGDPTEMGLASMHSFGAQFCEVRVSDVTGEVRVSRWLGIFDTGRVFNSRTGASQFRGGIVMGIGQALTEETSYDERSGRIVNPSLAEYHVPVHADVPHIDVTWLDEPDPLAPMGGKGVGEIGIVGVAAAIANAVHHATGKRIRALPLTPDRILAAPVDTPS